MKIVRIDANVHSMPFGGVAVTQGVGNMVKRDPWRDRLASNPLVVKDGFIEPNDEPGLGLTINEDILADYPAIAGSSYVPPR